ncbi:LOW QUALITY PROTEIN: uncharacterized protein LOC141954983 [Athene noctua]|uniref:LOW QUALITY PROTEIN: uncharacterized protein LOC141954983 n=1 Tax=Athene noctua TaxID=126797 RepID=UPI003EB95A7A
MDEVYQISSTEKVQQLEQELAAQLAELKSEIEDNRILQGIQSRAYSSVAIPKDASYFRKEREVILKKALQVAEAKPLVIQADVMQRELESCWRREHTAANLPLLLHQKQISHIMEEYNDAVQRAARLSAARESFLTGKENPVNVVTQEDLMIYTRWLVCHLHSLKDIHRFLQMNVAEEKHPDVVQDNWDKLRSAFDKNSDLFNIDMFPCSRVLRRNESCHKDTGITFPQHSTETKELKPQLQLLLSHFGIDYNLKDLKKSADEMVLFSLVIQKFRSVFCKQQTVRTFPVYDTEVSWSENWGVLDPSKALKKRANWVPFLEVHSAQFMEFAEVENHDDFHTSEDGYIHTQDQQGLYIIYDVALEDLKELENQLLLVASQYIEKDKSKIPAGPKHLNILGWAHASVDLCAVLLDLWTCETALLEKKCQLLDVYFEAYQHALDPEERFALAQAIMDIMHKRPRFDLKLDYFVNAYENECICLQLHLQLLREIVNRQIDAQREYVHKIWREGQRGGIGEFELPYNVITKQPISLNTSCPTLKNIYLLEFHPSLGLMCLIPKALEYIYQEFYSICRPKTASKASNLEKQVLQLVVDEWLTMQKPETLYSSQIKKDLFAEVLMEDPVMVQEIALSLSEVGTDEEKKTVREKQLFILDSFSTLLELATLHHQLIEAAVESAHLARFYKAFAMEAGFGEFHLYLRPVLFESASHREKADHVPPIFITSLLEDGSCVDRYIPSSLPLSIQGIDSHIGKFSFRTRDGVMQLLCPSGIRNMQLILACQVIQKNAFLAAVQQASFCYLVQPPHTLDLKRQLHYNDELSGLVCNFEFINK